MTAESTPLPPITNPSTATELEQAWRQWKGSFPEFMQDLDDRQVPYLSHSKVATVERCPKCYYKQYVLHEALSSNALTTGLLFHAAAAALYTARQKTPAGNAGDATAPAPVHPDRDEQPYLDSALESLAKNLWEEHEVIAVEDLFFMDLAPGLAPVIGVIDLILRKDHAYVVVDHKTGKRFGDPDPGQLQLYAEHVRRHHGITECAGAFDEYRLVPNLKRVRTPAFRRSRIPVDASRLPNLIERYQQAWETIARIHLNKNAQAAADCWFCSPPRSRQSWR